jgi:hypothetical protein
MPSCRSHRSHYWKSRLCRGPQTLGKGHQTLGKAFAKSSARHRPDGKFFSRPRFFAKHSSSRLRPSCSDVGKSQAGTIDDAVTNPQPPVLLSSSQGHDYVCINVMLTRVVILPLLLLTGLCVLRDAPAKLGLLYASGPSLTL